MHDFDQKDRGVITQIELLAAFNECKAERQVIILDL
jgi:hypothetical protein